MHNQALTATLHAKLHPSRFSAMSPKMAAIVGYILNQPFTKPQIVELTITSDHFVLARDEDHIGFDGFIGFEHDLERNWNSLLDAAQLTIWERAKAEELYCIRVKSLGGPYA